MPRYTYSCDDCNVDRIKRRKIEDRDNDTKCPICEKNMIRCIDNIAMTPSQWGDYHKTYKGQN